MCRADACKLNATHAIAVEILSVCPSVCQTRVCDKTKWWNADILVPHETAITLVFWHQQWCMAMLSEICAQSGRSPFEIRRLRPISAHNVSIVGDSEKSSITTNILKSTTGFPRAIDGVRTLPVNPERVAQRAIFSFLSRSQRLIVSGAVNLVRRWVS